MATTITPVESKESQKTALFEVIVSKQELLHELQFAQNVVERKTTVPQLSNFLLTANNGRLTISANDLSQSIQCSCPAGIVKDGKITVPGRKFFEYVRLLPDGKITLKALANGWTQIRSGRSNTKMMSMSAASYPEMPGFPESGVISLPANALKALLPRVAYAVSNEESRYILAGSLMILTPDSVSMVATDGHRLSLIRKNEEVFAGVVKEEKHLIPKAAIFQLIALLSSVQDEAVDFASTDSTLFFRIQGRVYTARKMTGNFPSFEAVIPKENNLVVIVNTNELLSSIQRVGQFSDSRSQCVRIKFGENEMTVSSSMADSGESEEAISTPYSGPAFTIGFNYPYMIDFLKSISGTDEVRLELKGATSSMVMRPESTQDLYDYKMILMPMRIS